MNNVLPYQTHTHYTLCRDKQQTPGKIHVTRSIDNSNQLLIKNNVPLNLLTIWPLITDLQRTELIKERFQRCVWIISCSNKFELLSDRKFRLQLLFKLSSWHFCWLSAIFSTGMFSADRASLFKILQQLEASHSMCKFVKKSLHTMTCFSTTKPWSLLLLLYKHL